MTCLSSTMVNGCRSAPLPVGMTVASALWAMVDFFWYKSVGASALFFLVRVCSFLAIIAVATGCWAYTD